MGHFPLLSVRFSSLSLACLGLLSVSAYADEAQGLAWLQSQSQTQVTASTIANGLQALSETSLTLNHIAGSNTGFDVTALQTKAQSTESLARFALLAHFQNADASAKAVIWTQLNDLQNEDGGFGHLQGWQSNPLDTAFVLLALAETGYVNSLSVTEQKAWQARVTQALNYLATQQRADGSYQVVSLDNLYVSSYVLSALSGYIQFKPDITPKVQTLVTYLTDNQVSAGKWSEHPQGLFIDALVSESLHPYSNGNTTIQDAFKQRALAAQQADGSWQSDAYVTAVVLDALDAQSKTDVVNPIAARLSLNVIDSETNRPLSGVTLTSNDGSSSQVSALSDTDGKITLINGKAGGYTLTLERDGYASMTFSVNLQQGQTLGLGQIKLNRDINVTTAQVQGKVTNSSNGSVLENAQVTIVMTDEVGQPLDNIAPIIATTGADGSYQVLLPQAGRFGIDIRKDDFLPVNGSGVATSGGVVLYNRSLISKANYAASITGQVVDEANQIIVGADIRLNDTVVGQTDSQGQFTLSNVSAGLQQLSIGKADYVIRHINVLLDAGSTQNVGTIVLPKQKDGTNPAAYSGNLKLKAIDSQSNQPIIGYKVVAVKLASDAQTTLQTQTFTPVSERDPFASVFLPIGNWKLVVTHPSYQGEYTQTINIGSQQTTEVEAQLTLTPYTATGVVQDAQSKAAITNAKVTVSDSISNDVLYTGSTDNEGRWTTDTSINRRHIKVVIEPEQHLPITLYFDKVTDARDNLDIGTTYVRALSAKDELADLTIKHIDSAQLITNDQTLATTGNLNLVLENKGSKAIAADTQIKVVAYVDTNHNQLLDDSDRIVGEYAHTQAMEKTSTANISLPITYASQFKDAPITIQVDTEKQVIELDEGNNTASTSEFRVIPKIGKIDPVVKYRWSFKASGQTTATSIAPIKDTNGDGVIGYGDVPIVIVTDRDFKGGRCCVTVRGIDFTQNGGEVAYETMVMGRTNAPVFADFDADGDSEMAVIDGDWGPNSDAGLPIRNEDYKHETVRFFDHEGQFIKKSAVNGTAYGYPMVVDIHHDGTPDVLTKDLNNAGNNTLRRTFGDYFSTQKGEIFRPQYGYVPELDDLNWATLSNFAYGVGGTGYLLADIERDGIPEAIFMTSYWQKFGLRAYDYTDITKSSKRIYGDYSVSFAGRINVVIDDIDNDNLPDFLYATNENEIVAFNNKAELLWKFGAENFTGDFAPHGSDKASSAGIAVFDLDGDGRKELISANDNSITILDALTGDVKARMLTNIKYKTSTNNWSRIKVVDVDADGHADMVYTNGGELIVISSESNSWADTRNIWNQEDYNITNINDDMTVPKYNRPWETHNSYGVQVNYGVPTETAADITASYVRVEDNGTAGSTLTARIGNAGSKSVAVGIPVSFYRVPPMVNGVAGTPELLKTVALSTELAANSVGAFEDVSINYAGSLVDFGELVVVANDAGAGIESATGIPADASTGSTQVIDEFTRSNNSTRLAIASGFEKLSLSASLEKTTYNSNEVVRIAANPTNMGSFSTNTIVRASVFDSAGNEITTLPEQPVTLGIGQDNNSALTQFVWNTSTSRVGNYRVQITLWRNQDGKLSQVTSLDRPFAVVADSAETGLVTTKVTTDKASYNTNDMVQANVRLQNTASNQVASKRTVTSELKDSRGKVFWSQNYAYDELAPNALKDQAFQISLQNATAGQYTLTTITKAVDGSQADQVTTTSFTVESSAQSGVGITGSLSTDTVQIELGSSTQLNWSINNTGDVDLSKLPVRIELFKGDSRTAFTSLPVNPADIAKGGNIAQSVMWNAVGVNNDQITAVLVATFDGVDKGLAVTRFTLIEPPIEAVINETNAITDPLLVYYSCENGWYSYAQNWSLGQFNYPCFDVRANYLTDYLNRLGVPYKLVKTPWEFRHELQSGKFENIWLLGAVEKLTPHTYKELREAAFMGDNVLVDSGMHSWLNHKLFHLAGMNYRGRLQLALPKDGGGDITLYPPLFTDPVPADLVSIPLNTKTRRKGYPFESNWAVLLEPRPTDSAYNQTQITASFNGAHKLDVFLEWIERTKKGNEDNYYNQTLRSYPAITQGTYGNSKPVALSFDLINSLTLATSNGMPTPTNTRPNLSEQRWDGTLKQLLKPRKQQATDYLPLEPVRIPVVVNNKGSSEKTVTVTVEMPQGAMWLDTKGGATLADAVELTPNHIQGKHTYQVTVPAKSQHSDILTLRLPKDAGTHGVRVTVANQANAQTGGQATVLDQQELRYVVRGVQARIDLLKSTVANWSVFSQNGFQVLNLKTQLGLINTHYKNGYLELAVYEAARMGTTFSEMQNTSDRDINALRLEGDELLRALQMQWYQSRNNVTPLP